MTQPLNDWTYCTLSVYGQNPHERETIYEIDRLASELIDPDDNSPLSFYQHSPIPQILVDNCYKIGADVEQSNVDECGYPYLHYFTKMAWGTPFDADDVVFTDEGSFVTYTFRVIDGNPMPWLKELSTAFPTLFFEIECENELELWDSFTSTIYNGDEIDTYYHKKQRNQ